MRYEYIVLRNISSEDLQSKLNEMGNLTWELIGATSDEYEEDWTCILKREKQNAHN